MLSFEGLNWWAIIVAAVAYFAVASIWYSPALFGSRWMTEVKADPNRGPNIMLFAQTLVIYFVMATVLSMIASGLGAESFVDGLWLGLAVGVAFVALQQRVNESYEGRSHMLWFINGGIGILGQVVMAVIITLWN